MPIASLGLAALLLSKLSSPAQASPSDFLVSQGSAYVASPIFAIKPASVYERFRWSSDATRLAFVSPTSTETPARIEKRLAAGENPDRATRIGVWNRETGQSREVFVASGASVDQFAFLGRDLLFVTTTPVEGGSASQLWLARDGGTAMKVEVPGLDGATKLLTSKRRQAVILIGSKKAWLIDATKTVEIKLPNQTGLIGRGVSTDDRAILLGVNAQNRATWYLADFVTGASEPLDQQPDEAKGPGPFPFILDAYRLNKGEQGQLMDDDDARVPSKMAVISDEDGGWRLDLVDRHPTRPRRLPFLHETARTVEISENGLAYAFVSNRTLMVRWMIKTDRPTSERLLRAGG